METKTSAVERNFSGIISVMRKKAADKAENLSYKDIFEDAKKAAKEEKQSENGLWSARRLKKKKLQAEIETLIHQKREMIEEINAEVATKREILMKQAIMENAPDLPITGVPAKYLLAGLPSLGSVSL